MDDQHSLERLTSALADRYRVEREIGRGGMATVYLAEDLKHRRRVAIKVLLPELTAGLGAERFLREIEISAKLTHPHILPLFDSGEADGLFYYVMPYVEGESLKDRLKRVGKLSVEETVRLTDQVASALMYAHDRGVVHRDIKPANILLTGDQAIIADFGIARAVEAASAEGLTGTGVAIGTPIYMSPEQAIGAGKVDARADIYALGCVVYEMVSGEAPFQGSGRQAIIAKQVMDRVPSLKKTDPAIPVYVDRAVSQAMATNPDDRFDTAGGFAEALTTGTVVPRVRAERARRARRRASFAGTAVATVALAAWGINALMSGQTMDRLAVLPLTDLTGDPDQAFVAAGVHESLIKELGNLGLSVTSRRTANQYQNTDKGIAEIAEDLGVDGVIEGSVFRDGDSLEIATRLYDRDEQEVWTGSFDGVMSDVVTLYRGFARAIAGQIRMSLSEEEDAQLAEASPVNPAVYELYLRGMQLLNTSSIRAQEDNEKAIDYFNQAVALDPADARAYAGLALGWATIGHGANPPTDAWPRARAAAERAIRLDSTLAEGWQALADYKAYSERDWEGAEEAFQKANRLNPSLAMNHYHYAWYLALFGRVKEALVEHRRAAELDRLTPLHTLWIPALYWYSREYDKALDEARLLTEEYPDQPLIWRILALSALEEGLEEEAIRAMERAVELSPGEARRQAVVHARTGRREAALEILRELEAQPPMPGRALAIARVHAALGNREETLRWLEYEPPHAHVAWYLTSPDVEFLRSDPRFQALARRMNLQLEPGQALPLALPPEVRPLSGTGG
jgi:serine/threonine-protein kinase